MVCKMETIPVYEFILGFLIWWFHGYVAIRNDSLQDSFLWPDEILSALTNDYGTILVSCFTRVVSDI